MNRPSRNDDNGPHPDWNQSPPSLAADLTTRSDLNGIANSRLYRGHRLHDAEEAGLELQPLDDDLGGRGSGGCKSAGLVTSTAVVDEDRLEHVLDGRGGSKAAGLVSSTIAVDGPRSDHVPDGRGGGKAAGLMSSTVAVDEQSLRNASASGDTTDASSSNCDVPKGNGRNIFGRTGRVLAKYAKFIGPGAMVSVAYIDPGNYATDVSAGASYRFKLLFMVLLSNIFAIFLQSLCIKLGSVTGMNLAEMCKAHTPRWLNIILYLFAEAAIIATDIAEVIGTAIALNLLFKLPLVAGCAISIVDVLLFLLFYSPNGSMRGLRAFELSVMGLVLAVVVCFCFQLSLITGATAGEVFKGYLPSSALVQANGLYQSCGILGATVMPHSLYLGSGLIQSRLKEFDVKHNTMQQAPGDDEERERKYQPSLSAIKACMNYSIAELVVSLFTFALFINSAILIVAGASLSSVSDAANANLFGIYALLTTQISKAAGVVFALALLFSGTSAGIVCTIAGQMVSEGQLDWSVRPWIRRLITRCISITPSIIIAAAVGEKGVSAALEASQVALSIILPFVSAPLIYFTCSGKLMTVRRDASGGEGEGGGADVKMRNNWVTSVFAILIWGVIVIMNVALIVLLGLGVE